MRRPILVFAVLAFLCVVPALAAQTPQEPKVVVPKIEEWPLKDQGELVIKDIELDKPTKPVRVVVTIHNDPEHKDWLGLVYYLVLGGEKKMFFKRWNVRPWADDEKDEIAQQNHCTILQAKYQNNSGCWELTYGKGYNFLQAKHAMLLHYFDYPTIGQDEWKAGKTGGRLFTYTYARQVKPDGTDLRRGSLYFEIGDWRSHFVYAVFIDLQEKKQEPTQ